jgi:ankyrin repeat domain-containing protein 50
MRKARLSRYYSSTIIEDVKNHRQQASAVAYFYFEFSDTKKQRHENLTRSLIVQLSAQSTSTPKILEELYARHQNDQQKPSTEELVAALKEIINSSQKTYIIVDALDECAEREELLLSIKEMAQWSTRKLHIIVTSRREKDIDEALKPLVTDEICIQSKLVKADIQLHIRERLQHDQKLKWPTKVQEELEETLTEGAHGMYERYLLPPRFDNKRH